MDRLQPRQQACKEHESSLAKSHHVHHRGARIMTEQYMTEQIPMTFKLSSTVSLVSCCLSLFCCKVFLHHVRGYGASRTLCRRHLPHQPVRQTSNLHINNHHDPVIASHCSILYILPLLGQDIAICQSTSRKYSADATRIVCAACSWVFCLQRYHV